MTDEILSVISDQVFGVWFLIGAALVFWMQAGFAMVEAGFTRAKNTGNIIMKNLMDFCIGTVVFILLGFGLFLGDDIGGIIGKPNFAIFTDYANFDWSGFVFNLVFCATTATIVSGAMAERTKFLSYCIYSAVISAVIYPIEAHWTWGGGWLAQMGFHDFAGSNCIHMVGGISALIGAYLLGPRIGKFKKKKDGSIKVGAFPGHNIALGALGVFIVGAVSGVLVVFGVWLLDYKLRIDDPVGAVAVHMMNGIWGTLAVGLVATDTAPTYSLAGANGEKLLGLFYGGGFKLLGIQFTGMLCTALWTAITITITFLVIKKTVGLRVTAEEEIAGLDATEHGLESAYSGFVISDSVNTIGDSALAAIAASTPEPEEKKVPMDDAVPVQVREPKETLASDVKLSKVTIICKQNKFEDLNTSLNEIGVKGLTVTQVLGCGTQKGKAEYYRGVPVEFSLLPKIKVEVVVSAVPVKAVIDAAKRALYTGHIGDGKIFVYDVEDVVKVRTGESGFDALQDDK